jgi:hypothetical protein
MSSKKDNTNAQLLLFQLVDIDMFNRYGSNLYIEAKKYCEVHECLENDPLANAVCNYCNQSDNPDEWYDCMNSECSVAYHKDYCYVKAGKPGYFVDNTDWYCSSDCQEKYLDTDQK